MRAHTTTVWPHSLG